VKGKGPSALSPSSLKKCPPLSPPPSPSPSKKGNAVMMARVFPYAGVQFMVFDYMRHYWGTMPGGMTPGRSLISGSAAGLTSTVITYPLDLARARLAVQKGRNKPGMGGVKR
jgi:hypothetical protein